VSTTETRQEAAGSSRTDVRFADWHCTEPGTFQKLEPPGRQPLASSIGDTEFATWVDPPLFTNFLRLDVSATKLRVRCFASTGCGEQEGDPPVEDDFTLRLTGSGV
jgi:hypothetical protein